MMNNQKKNVVNDTKSQQSTNNPKQGERT